MMRKLRFAILLFLSVASMSMGKKTLGVEAWTYAVEVISDSSLLSIGALEFHFDRNEIRVVTFPDALDTMKVQTIINIYTVREVKYAGKDMVLFSGVNPYGFNFTGRIYLTNGNMIVPDFEIVVNGRAKLLIRPLSNKGKPYRQKYLANVNLGLERVE